MMTRRERLETAKRKWRLLSDAEKERRLNQAESLVRYFEVADNLQQKRLTKIKLL